MYEHFPRARPGDVITGQLWSRILAALERLDRRAVAGAGAAGVRAQAGSTLSAPFNDGAYPVLVRLDLSDRLMAKNQDGTPKDAVQYFGGVRLDAGGGDAGKVWVGRPTSFYYRTAAVLAYRSGVNNSATAGDYADGTLRPLYTVIEGPSAFVVQYGSTVDKGRFSVIGPPPANSGPVVAGFVGGLPSNPAAAPTFVDYGTQYGNTPQGTPLGSIGGAVGGGPIKAPSVKGDLVPVMGGGGEFDNVPPTTVSVDRSSGLFFGPGSDPDNRQRRKYVISAAVATPTQGGMIGTGGQSFRGPKSLGGITAPSLAAINQAGAQTLFIDSGSFTVTGAVALGGCSCRNFTCQLARMPGPSFFPDIQAGILLTAGLAVQIGPPGPLAGLDGGSV